MVGYNENDSLTPNMKLIAGCVSGCTTRFLTQPLDVIKMRAQVAKKKKIGYVPLTFKIFRENGITAFWRGHNIGQIYSISSVSLQFYFFEYSTVYAYNYLGVDRKYSAMTNFICGCISGCASTALVSPFDVVRIRQVVNKDSGRGIISSFRTVYQSGGIPAFYEGLSAAFLQIGPALGISFATFNLTQSLLTKYLFVSEPKKQKGMSSGTSFQNRLTPQQLILSSVIAGAVTGFVSKTLTYPFDLVKRRLQLATHQAEINIGKKKLVRCRSISKCIKNIIQNDGFKGLYRGYSVTIMKAQLTSVITFTTYELMCYVIREVGV